MPAPDSATGTITLRGPQEKLGQGKRFKNKMLLESKNKIIFFGYCIFK